MFISQILEIFLIVLKHLLCGRIMHFFIALHTTVLTTIFLDVLLIIFSSNWLAFFLHLSIFVGFIAIFDALIFLLNGPFFILGIFLVLLSYFFVLILLLRVVEV